MPYYRGRGYGPDAWVLLIGAAGIAVLTGIVVLLVLSRSGFLG